MSIDRDLLERVIADAEASLLDLPPAGPQPVMIHVPCDLPLALRGFERELWFGFGDPKRRGKWFVNLVDENDLEGPVVVWNDDGAGGDMTMPQEMFRALRDSGREMPYTGVDVVKLPPTLVHLRP